MLSGFELYPRWVPLALRNHHKKRFITEAKQHLLYVLLTLFR